MEYVLSLACIRSGKDAYHFLLGHLYADSSARPKSFACRPTPFALLRVTPAKRLNRQILGGPRDFACGLTLRYARKTTQLNKTFCFLFTEMDCLSEIIICNNRSG